MNAATPFPSAQNDPATLPFAARISRYEIHEELGRGGMGIVYKAYDPVLNRAVAVKVLRLIPGARTEDLERRFWREAQAIGRLNHPHIVQVYDAGVAGDQWYLVMEYLAGRTLDKVVQQEGALSLERVAGIVAQVCTALEYAHERQTVHRDIKPSNIMLVENDQVKVADFGLASFTSEISLTQTEGLVGTPHYMSPEQISHSSRVDGRSDIFSLGAVVYELLTGRLLFPGENVTPIFQIVSPSPVDLDDANLSDSICIVLQRALAKDVSARFSTCAEFAAAFASAATDHTAQSLVIDDADTDEQMPPEQGRYTAAYRAVEARQVMGWIKAGESGCLIGLRGAGKSNFLRFVLSHTARQHYLGQGWADFSLVLIDLLALTEYAEWAVFELILDRLIAQLASMKISPATNTEIEALHREVTQTRSALTARQAIERCVAMLCLSPARRIVLLLDEFDAVFRKLDPSLFRCLRAIRDAHKDQVSILVIVTNDLTLQRGDLPEVEHFYRLVSRNVCGLGPYSEADARQMIGHISARRSIALSAEDTTHLIALCGGHAGLIKASLSLIWSEQQARSLEEIASALGDESTVQAECQKMWDGISDSEQIALGALVNGEAVDPEALRRLKRKGLVRQGQPEPLGLFSPLFADYVRRQALPSSDNPS